MKKYLIIGLTSAAIHALATVLIAIYLDAITTIILWSTAVPTALGALAGFVLHEEFEKTNPKQTPSYSSNHQLKKVKEKIIQLKKTQYIGPKTNLKQKYQRIGMKEGLQMAIEIIDENSRLSKECNKTTTECAELQKQVSDFKEEHENMQSVIFGLEEDKHQLQKQVNELKERAKIDLKNEKNWSKIQTKQAVKDTVKEILIMFDDRNHITENDLKKAIAERYGVEIKS